ncbi:MAG TPA: hypothetical protein VED41_06325, partial [Solirubrobacteraceae bacterium]|nr:hypothetical protein [Solirubrobacteraceae bacterium]
FESDFLSQPLDESRTLEQTLERAWDVTSLLARSELSMVSPATLDEHYRAGEHSERDATRAGEVPDEQHGTANPTR